MAKDYFNMTDVDNHQNYTYFQYDTAVCFNVTTLHLLNIVINRNR